MNSTREDRIKAIVSLAAMLLFAGVGLVACGDDDDEDAAGGGGATVEVSMTEYAFKPKDLTVSEEDRVVATNDGQIPHNYSILGGQEEIGASTEDIDPGSSGELLPEVADFGPSPQGDPYVVICTIPGHAKKGMKGTLTITK